MNSLTKRCLVQCWCMHTLKTSARCHSMSHIKLELKKVQKTPKQKRSLVVLGAPDCLVVPWTGDLESPESFQRVCKGLREAPVCPMCTGQVCAMFGGPLYNGQLSDIASRSTLEAHRAIRCDHSQNNAVTTSLCWLGYLYPFQQPHALSCYPNHPEFIVLSLEVHIAQ